MNKLTLIALCAGWTGRGIAGHPRVWRWLMRKTMSPLLAPQQRVRLLRLLGIPVHASSYIADNVFIGSSLVSFGENSGCSVDCFFDGYGRIYIGDNVRLGARCMIITSTHPVEESVVRRDLSKETIAGDVRIGRGSWLCSNVTVIPGVEIGEGCVVGAGSVVAENLAPNGLYAGVPARRVRDLAISIDTSPAIFEVMEDMELQNEVPYRMK